MSANRHKVPKKQWRKWCDLARRVFNATYLQLARGGGILAPGLEDFPQRRIRIIAWNAAWLAADNVQEQLEAMAGE